MDGSWAVLCLGWWALGRITVSACCIVGHHGFASIRYQIIGIVIMHDRVLLTS